MSIRIVRLGTPRQKGEGLRIGTVRLLPRGVPKKEYAARDYFDVWLPNLAPSKELMHGFMASEKTEAQWRKFAASYRKHLEQPDTKHIVSLLVRMSEVTNLSVGCYCEDESRCHRSVLREVLQKEGAKVLFR